MEETQQQAPLSTAPLSSPAPNADEDRPVIDGDGDRDDTGNASNVAAAAGKGEDENNKDAATDATAESTADNAKVEGTSSSGGGPTPVVSSSKKSRPPYKYDPNKITLRFLFANRDGLTVTIECEPSDTVGEVKGALLSVWPEDLPDCSGGDRLRLVCMGKGYLMPDTRTLEDCQIPIFKTHPTPINVSVAPPADSAEDPTSPNSKKVNKKEDGSALPAGAAAGSGAGGGGGGAGNNGAPNSPNSAAQGVSQGCACVIL